MLRRPLGQRELEEPREDRPRRAPRGRTRPGSRDRAASRRTRTRRRRTSAPSRPRSRAGLSSAICRTSPPTTKMTGRKSCRSRAGNCRASASQTQPRARGSRARRRRCRESPTARADHSAPAVGSRIMSQTMTPATTTRNAAMESAARSGRRSRFRSERDRSLHEADVLEDGLRRLRSRSRAAVLNSSPAS